MAFKTAKEGWIRGWAARGPRASGPVRTAGRRSGSVPCVPSPLNNVPARGHGQLHAFRPGHGTAAAGPTVPVQWTDANVPSGSTISLAYDTTSNWGNPKWIEVDGVSRADGSGTNNWKTTGLGRGPITSTATCTRRRPAGAAYAHLTTSFTVTAPPPSFTLSGPASGTTSRGRRSRSNGPMPMSPAEARSAWPTTRPATGATRSGSRSTGSARPTAAAPTVGTRRAWRPGPITSPATCTRRRPAAWSTRTSRPRSR